MALVGAAPLSGLASSPLRLESLAADEVLGSDTGVDGRDGLLSERAGWVELRRLRKDNKPPLLGFSSVATGCVNDARFSNTFHPAGMSESGAGLAFNLMVASQAIDAFEEEAK